MKYVVDTSVDIKTYVQEQGSAKAVRLRNEYHRGVERLAVRERMQVGVRALRQRLQVGVVPMHGLGAQEESPARDAETALQASEARYRSVVETAQEGIWIVDAAYRTTFVNARMAQMLGYSTDDILALRIDGVIT